MPWKVSDVTEQRFEFILEWQSGGWTVAGLCRRYGISRATGYKWLGRYEEAGVEGLWDRSRAPHHHPNAVSEEMEERVLAVRGEHPYWGARKIQARMERVGGGGAIPAASTIGAMLKQHGLTWARKKRRAVGRRGEPLAHAVGPNVVWCADFKGWFRTQDGARCEPLTISDAYSRYVLRCQALKAAEGQRTKRVFEAAFQEYGLPERMRTDNGPPFVSVSSSGLTALTVWWIKLGIVPERIEPGKPGQNGSHERMHRTLKQETAQVPARSRRAQQQRFDAFREEYNCQRPHEALGMATPAEYYSPSPRPYPARLPEVSYPADWEVRLVCAGGQIRWWQRKVFVSQALAGEPVGLEPVDDRYWRMYFCGYELGVLDSAEGKLWTPAQWQKRQPSRAGSEGPRLEVGVTPEERT